MINTDLTRSEISLLRFLAIYPGWHMINQLLLFKGVDVDWATINALVARQRIWRQGGLVRINPAGKIIIEEHTLERST